MVESRIWNFCFGTIPSIFLLIALIFFTEATTPRGMVWHSGGIIFCFIILLMSLIMTFGKD